MVGSFNKENVLCQVQHCRCQTLPNTAYAPDLTRMTRLHAAAGWVQEASSWVAWSSVALSASTHPPTHDLPVFPGTEVQVNFAAN